MDINPSKSGERQGGANLQVLSMCNAVPITTVVLSMAPDMSYWYMGVMLNVDLNWTDHMEYEQ